jgi:predicted transcriptional regulator
MKKRYKPGTFITVPSKYRLAELDGLTQSAYMWLCDHADRNTGLCFPSIERLAMLCKVSRNTIRNRIQKLETTGLIVRTRRKRSNGTNMPNLYQVLEDNYVPKKKHRSIAAPYGSENELEMVQGLSSNHNHYEQKPDNKRVNALAVLRLRYGTPEELAEVFFKDMSVQDMVINTMSEALDSERSFVKKEIGKFLAYWTEPNGAGTKVKWQMQQTFEVGRRLFAWFSRVENHRRPGAGITI